MPLSLNQLSVNIPRGAASLFFIQIFATLAFAMLYPTLELYMVDGLKLPVVLANAILGAFLAFNYGLHLLGGFFGGRLLSFRNLFVTGMVLQIVGCVILSILSFASLTWGMAFFLVGSGLNVTCINMMLTQLFAPQDKRRETAFLWNYSGMNLGFFIGFAVAGYFQLENNYHMLFLLCTSGNLIAIVLTAVNWHKLRDRKTILSQLPFKAYAGRTVLGFFCVICMVPILLCLLKHAHLSNEIVLLTGFVILLVMLVLALRQPELHFKKKMLAYLILVLSSLVFWSLYQIAPIGLTTFAEYNVNRHVFGFTISPQWILNINAFVIMFGGPTMPIFLKKIRTRYPHFSIPHQFTSALLLIGIGFLLLPIGIHLAPSDGLSSFQWIFWSYVIQSLGELLISPIGYAMIGQLAPPGLGGIMMGVWMLFSGVGGVLSSYASTWAGGSSNSLNPLMTNPGYAHVFQILGWGAVACGVLFFMLIPMLRRLINESH